MFSKPAESTTENTEITEKKRSKTRSQGRENDWRRAPALLSLCDLCVLCGGWIGRMNHGERIQAQGTNLRDRPARVCQGLRRRQRRQYHRAPERQGALVHADDDLEGVHQAGRYLQGRLRGQATRRQAQAVE